ncbi:MAG: RNA 2',3'-cyclic phosphodiesterase [Syntrophobacterales bacterium]|nr:RNA 2',3'-cyclic phosphodiesterase [Syntrophobacterales bacterium]
MAEDTGVIRAFIAIDLPEIVKRDLENLQKILMSETKKIRWVRPEGIHLTLKFLGNIRINFIQKIEEIIKGVVQHYKPLRLTPKGCGAFPSLKNIRVIWVGLEGDVDILRELQKTLEQELEVIGFPKEDRHFTPHLTLGRAKDSYRDERLSKALLLNASTFQSSSFYADEIVIFKSTLTPSGAIYSKISAIKLSQ